MPCRAVRHCLQTGVDVVLRTASPALSARHQFEFHHTFGAKIDGHGAVRVLRCGGHEQSGAAFQGSQHFGPADDLRKMWRANLLLPFCYEDKVYRGLALRRTNGVQRSKECRLWALLVDGSTTDNHFAESRLLDQSCVKRWRRPFGGIDLLHVIHEIETDGLGSARIQCRKYSRLPIGGNLSYLVEAGIAQHVHKQATAFLHSTIFSGDRRLTNPGLQSLNTLIVELPDLVPDGLEVGVLGLCRVWKRYAGG